MMFYGSIVALVTPMQPDGEIDFSAMQRLVEWHIAEGTQGLVVAGTTGESPTLTNPERQQLIRVVVEQAAGRVPVIAGTGTNATATTIELTREAMELGVDACLLITPYYNKPTQEGLYRHHATVAEAVPLPQILYNLPGRTACDMLPETVARLALIPNIVGLKEATGHIERLKELREICGNNQLDWLSGDDLTALEFMRQGGKGVISVTANVAPKAMRQLCDAALQGDQLAAHTINERLLNLHQALFVETNPIPVKWLLAEQGYISSGIRLPLTPLAECYHTRLRDAAKQAILSS